MLAVLEIKRHGLILTRHFKAQRLSQLGKQAHGLKLCDTTGYGYRNRVA